MRGRKRIISFVLLLSVVSILPLAFSLSLVNVMQSSLLGSVIPLSPGGETVSVSKVIDGTKRIGTTFTVTVDVSSVTDLYTWQVYLSFNKSVVTVKQITPGAFLATSPNPTASEVLPGDWAINYTDNAAGTSMSADTILGVIGGVAGSGRLASIEFNVVGNGKTVLTIDTSKTFLLNSAGTSIGYTKTDGWFNNVPGDTNWSGKVDGADASALGLAWYTVPGKPTWNSMCDFDNSGKVDGADASLIGLYWFKVFYIP